MSTLPRHRTIVTVDVEGSTMQTNHRRARMREVLYEVVENALLAAGISEAHRDPLIDRGDGILILIHPSDAVPKTIVLTTMIPVLARQLADHAKHGPTRLRLRAVVHAGEVHYDRYGCYGEALDLTYRLLDAPGLKDALVRAPGELALVASDDIYRAVIRHDYDGIDTSTFQPTINVTLGGEHHLGWVQTTTPAAIENEEHDLTA